MKPRLIVIDGLDGCGKSTQFRRLMDVLPKDDVVFTREPGGTAYAERIRALILSAHEEGEKVPNDTYFHLMWAARITHIENVIRPALDGGQAVISDRFDSSTFAFQLSGHDAMHLVPLFSILHDMHVVPLAPTYIILDLHPNEAYRRMEKDNERNATHFDLMPRQYHFRVRRGFEMFAQRATCRFVNASQSIDDIHKGILSIVQEILEL